MLNGMASTTRTRIRLVSLLSVAVALAACSRGPAPPAPTEDLTPTFIGVIAKQVATPPVLLRGDRTFPPSPGASVERIRNWPDLDAPADPFADFPRLDPEVLLLAGQRSDGVWWYELADGANQDGCHMIYGGSFDEGDTVRLSSGLRLPKAPGFNVRGGGRVLDDVDSFPGHGGDGICVDEQGRAIYFNRFIGQ
jgi:hypothetical protein